jgi:hypothetical protein
MILSCISKASGDKGHRESCVLDIGAASTYFIIAKLLPGSVSVQLSIPTEDNWVTVDFWMYWLLAENPSVRLPVISNFAANCSGFGIAPSKAARDTIHKSSAGATEPVMHSGIAAAFSIQS